MSVPEDCPAKHELQEIQERRGSWYWHLRTFIRDLGFPIAVACYFLFRDYIFTERMIVLQTKIAIALDEIARQGLVH